jgi:hypothetical protein
LEKTSGKKILEITAEIRRINGGQKTNGLTLSLKKEEYLDIEQTI